MAPWQGIKTTTRVMMFQGENLIMGEYNVPYRWPFSGSDAHPPHAINQTNISAHSCNPSEQLFSKSIKFSYELIGKKSTPCRQGVEDTGHNNSTKHNIKLFGRNTLPFFSISTSNNAVNE